MKLIIFMKVTYCSLVCESLNEVDDHDSMAAGA